MRVVVEEGPENVGGGVPKEWQLNSVPRDELETWVVNQRTLGWQMGEVSGGLAAVDSDCEEAELLAPTFLPDTLKIGKGDHPPSVYVYRCPGLGYAAFNDPGDATDRLIDIKASNNGKGHQIVVPPTVHRDKGPYHFVGVGVGEFDPSHITKVDKEELEACIGELVAAAAIARHLPERGRHDLALALVGFLGRHEVRGDVIARVLHAAWEYNGAPHHHHQDIDAIIRDTFLKLERGAPVTGGRRLKDFLGERFPRLLACAFGFEGSERAESTANQNTGKAKKNKGAKDEDEPPTHDELRDRWIMANPDYAYGLEDWRKYEGGIWPIVKAPVVRDSMVRVLEDAKEEGIKPSVFVLNSVHALAQTRTYIADDIWDNQPDIIVCENECIDTRTGDVIPHSRAHYATTRVPCVYNPHAEAPNWRRFLRYIESVTNAETVQFLKEFAGYCLTLDTKLEKALWLVGPPGGGKSTLIEGFKAVLAERSGTLGLREIERSRFSLSKIVGKSLVTSTEQPSGFVGCHDIVNAIISGEEIQIERKFKQPCDYIPRAKIVWSMNELPRVPSGAEGLFRRIEVVRLPKLEEDAKDPDLKESIKGEAEGILAWAVEGLLVLKERGDFKIPKSVEEETEEFKANNDIPAAFVEEACYTDPSLVQKSSSLYKSYRQWCESNGYTPKAHNTVGEDWKRLGFRRKKEPEGIFWHGVRVREKYLAYEY